MSGSINVIEQNDLSKVTCAADMNVAGHVEQALKDMKLPEVYIQRAKQTTLVERGGFLGLRSRVTMEENRAAFYRFYVPREFELGVMRRVAEAADLYLPGRGSIYAKDARLLRAAPLEFDRPLLRSLCEAENSLDKSAPENYAVLIAIVQKGAAAELAETVLEMGRCVPLISFGKGVGLRNRLGLLRITLPIEREISYFIVPKIDADWLEKTICGKARIGQPGQGILYRTYVRGAAVNLLARRGKKQQYAASMEQIIAALDDLRGSNEWRRYEAKQGAAAGESQGEELLTFSLIGEEGKQDEFISAALAAGAGGATMTPLEQQDYSRSDMGGVSHAREICDIVIPAGLFNGMVQAVKEAGFFASDSAVPSLIEAAQVFRSVSWTR